MKFLEALGGRPSPERKQRALTSGHYANGKFVNSVPTIKLLPSSVARMIWEQLSGKEERVPKRSIPVVPRSARDFAERLAPDALRVTWLGHASTLIEIGGKRVLTDPVWSPRVSPFESIGPKRFFNPPIALNDLPEIDAVLISHDHYDHLDMATVKFLAALGIQFYVPLSVGAHFERWGVPGDQVVELNWHEGVSLGDLNLTLTPARHFSGRRLTDEYATFWGSFVLTATSGRKVFYSGDTGPLDAFAEIGERYGPFDFTVMQIGACSQYWPQIHMTPAEAVHAHRQLRGSILIPGHWGTFNLALHAWNAPARWLTEAAEAANVAYRIPKPGEFVTVVNVEDAQRAPDLWWS